MNKEENKLITSLKYLNVFDTNNENNDILDIFIKRMDKLGIKIELINNYPWIYIDKINGKKVIEKFQGNHGFTIAFLPIRKEQKMKFTDIGEIFRLIRKYCV